MPLDTHLTAMPITTIDPVPGVFYGPCSGRDLPIVFRLCGDRINHFTFCDLSYGHRDTSAASAVPQDWIMVSRVMGLDEKQPTKTSRYNGNRLIRPTVVREVWRRPNGTEVMVELRRDLAEDVLVQQFTSKSISIFLHHKDGVGEGGSNLWFLGSNSSGDVGHDGTALLEILADRLAHGAIVITDGQLTDSGFRRSRPFRSQGIEWTPLGIVDDGLSLGRTTLAWRANRVGDTLN